MNRETTRLLAEYELPQTAVFSLEQAAVQPDDVLMYLRYVSTSAFRIARPVTSQEIRRDLPELQRRREKGELVTCERWYETLIGGASYVGPEFVYSECVDGHSSALLRRGCCGGRLITFQDGDAHAEPVLQRWRVQSREQGLCAPAGSLDLDRLHKVQARLKPLLGIAGMGMLLEWMWTTDGWFFCDAKRMHDPSFGAALPRVLRSSNGCIPVRPMAGDAPRQANARVIVDAVDCELQEPARDGDTVYCVNGALLSHFVTRAVDLRVGIYLLRAESLLATTLS